MSDEPRPLIGFVGLGTMGAPMASNLQKAGHKLIVHDSRRGAAAPHIEAGGIWANSPREVGQQCDVVFTCLPNVAAIEAVALGADGLITGMREGSAFFEMSTNSPELVKNVCPRRSANAAFICSTRRSAGAAPGRAGA